MSKFFADIEEEKKEIKKKLHSTQKPTEKLSKKDKLLQELNKRIIEVKENPKIIKRFVADLKKYDSIGLPDNLKEILLSPDVYVKGNKKIIDEYINKHEKKEEITEEVTENNFEADSEVIDKREDEEAEYNKILKLSRDEKIIKLEELKNRVKDESIKINILINLLSNYIKCKDTIKGGEIFLELCNYKDQSRVKTLFDYNLDGYLDTFSITDSSLYKTILLKVKDINEQIYERRMLDIEYYENKNYIDTKYMDFKLLRFIHMEKICECSKLIDELENIEYKDKLFFKNIEEAGNMLFKNNNFEESYKCLSYLFNINNEIPKTLKKQLYILCVILNRKVKDTHAFKIFLEHFKMFESNYLVLKSNDDTMEIFRAFYLLHESEIQGCVKVLNSLCENTIKDESSVFNPVLATIIDSQ